MPHRFSLVLPVVSFLLLPLTAGCGGASSTGTVASAIRFDPCQPLTVVVDPGTATDRETGVHAAVDLWNGAAGARLLVSEGSTTPAVDPSGAADATLPLRFQTAVALSHGFYDPDLGEVLINDDLTAGPLAVTIAHEIGHAFGLVHVSGRASVMNPGNLDVEPNAGDVTDLAALWGRCGAAPSTAPSAAPSD